MKARTKCKTEIIVNSHHHAPARFQHRGDWYYATGRYGSYDDGAVIGAAYEYEAGRGSLIWVADDFKTVLHEPERDVDGRRDQWVVRARILLGMPDASPLAASVP